MAVFDPATGVMRRLNVAGATFGEHRYAVTDDDKAIAVRPESMVEAHADHALTCPRQHGYAS